MNDNISGKSAIDLLIPLQGIGVNGKSIKKGK